MIDQVFKIKAQTVIKRTLKKTSFQTFFSENHGQTKNLHDKQDISKRTQKTSLRINSRLEPN